jgi:hypothetical protein
MNVPVHVEESPGIGFFRANAPGKFVARIARLTEPGVVVQLFFVVAER